MQQPQDSGWFKIQDATMQSLMLALLAVSTIFLFQHLKFLVNYDTSESVSEKERIGYIILLYEVV